MDSGRAFFRLIVLSAAALAVSCVPIARAFADAAQIPSSSASLIPARAARSSVPLARHMPRPRRPKQSYFVLLPESVPLVPAVSSGRRLIPAREPSARAASFGAPPDHPPA